MDYRSGGSDDRDAITIRVQQQPSRGLATMPTIITTDDRGNKISRDLDSYLFDQRIIVLSDVVDEVTATLIVEKMLALDAMDPAKPITFVINSPGGMVSAGLSIYDTMQQLRAPVNTVCTGMAASMGMFLLCTGTGTRTIQPNAIVMMHQLSGGTFGKYSEMESSMGLSTFYENKLEQIIALHTGQKVARVRAWARANGDKWFSPQEALEFGIVDGIQLRKLVGTPVRGYSKPDRIHPEITDLRVGTRRTNVPGKQTNPGRQAPPTPGTDAPGTDKPTDTGRLSLCA